MAASLIQVVPKILPPLDPDFRPAYLGNKHFEAEVRKSRKGVPMVFAIQASGGSVTQFKTVAFPSGHPMAPENLAYAERIVKFLLWARGGWKVSVAGPKEVAAHLKRVYSARGPRAFDYKFMGQVYEKAGIVIEAKSLKAIPKAKDTAQAVGRHLDGCRIGFDAGGSDRKVAAVVHGKEVFSTETVWEPKITSNPQYHIDGINDSIAQAAAHMPRIDAIGVSSAGIYVSNRCMVASLFRKIPKAQFDKKIKSIYLDVAKKWGDVPIEVANDGDVTALAGAMSLRENQVLGIAMGTSQAVGYVDKRGYITGWLNELAFAPIDYSDQAAHDHEWSGDHGTGVNYFSQDAVIRLAPRIGFKLDAKTAPGTRLKVVQNALKAGDQGVKKIFESIGVYLGYAVLQYARFYDIKHVLLLGRVTSGKGGDIVIAKATQVMRAEDPALARHIRLTLPDEASRRVGQAIAAASLPVIKKTVLNKKKKAAPKKK